MDKIYDETVKSEVKKEILLDMQQRFPSKKKETNYPKPQRSNLHS